MTLSLNCKDAGDPVCTHTMFGETEEELIENARIHGIQVHGYTGVYYNSLSVVVYSLNSLENSLAFPAGTKNCRLLHTLQNINEVSIVPGVPSPKSNCNLMFGLPLPK